MITQSDLSFHQSLVYENYRAVDVELERMARHFRLNDNMPAETLTRSLQITNVENCATSMRSRIDNPFTHQQLLDFISHGFAEYADFMEMSVG